MKPLSIGLLVCDEVALELQAKQGSYTDMLITWMLLGIPERLQPTIKFHEYQVYQGQLPDSPKIHQAYLTSGSKFSVNDPIPWVQAFADFTLNALKDSVPYVGICFGHQMLAKVLGANVCVSNKGWGIGVTEYPFYFTDTLQITDTLQPFDTAQTLNTSQKLNTAQTFNTSQATNTSQTTHSSKAIDSLDAPLPMPEKAHINLCISHKEQVNQLPNNSQVLAGNAFCPHAVVAFSQSAIGIQGHPEFPLEYCRDLLNLRKAQYPEQVYQQAIASLKQGIQPDIWARWVWSFISTLSA